MNDSSPQPPPIEEAEPIQDRSAFLAFRSTDIDLALPLEQIREITTVDRIYYVPGAPAHFPGVINVRGNIESVFSLPVFLGLGPGTGSAHKAIIVATDTARTAILVDEVSDIIDAAPSEILAPPASLTHHVADYVTGCIEVQAGSWLVIDLNRLLRSAVPDAS